jgi:septum formation protein
LVRVLSKRNKIILASASPRRKFLLRPFYHLKIVPTDIDERQLKGELPLTYVRRVALEKWKAASAHITRGEIIVSADTVVILGRTIFGKPRDRTHAAKTLRALSGKTHKVVTAIVVGRAGFQPKMKTVRTSVELRELHAREIAQYIESGEWRGKAGSYAIQGHAGAFVSKISGSLTCVVGLPLEETLRLIEHVRAQ